ncbi:MAG: hypothetical protein U1F65_08840 [Verrucomicrobiota bacterium]
MSDQPGVKVRGTYQVPAGIDGFPRPLIAEAVGQLAAWSAMAAMEFRVRPVAGIAASVELLGEVRPGQTLELAADLETVDMEAVSYCGEAFVDGVKVIKLNHCVGPMLPQEDFDDTTAVKARYAQLGNGGVASGAYGGVPNVEFVSVTHEPGQWVRATLPIPGSALFFDDHFARRPVFPGTLFMNKALELSSRLAADLPAGNGSRWVARTIADGKLRAFIPPGDQLDYEVKVAAQEAGSLTIAVEARRAKRVSGNAKIIFKAEPNS